MKYIALNLKMIYSNIFVQIFLQWNSCISLVLLSYVCYCSRPIQCKNSPIYYIREMSVSNMLQYFQWMASGENKCYAKHRSSFWIYSVYTLPFKINNVKIQEGSLKRLQLWICLLVCFLLLYGKFIVLLFKLQMCFSFSFLNVTAKQQKCSWRD